MLDRCEKCDNLFKKGKIYEFRYGEYISFYSYDTSKYDGNKETITTHTSTKFRLHGIERCYICNECIIKQAINIKIRTTILSILTLLLAGVCLFFLFSSAVPILITSVISFLLLIFSIRITIKDMEIAKSEHEKKQLFYLSKNNLYEIGCQMAIKIRKHKVPFISDNEVVFLSPAEYVKVKITKV